MGFQKPKGARPHEPSGFTLRSGGRASERARQQGWQTNQEERIGEAHGKQAGDGGTDYEYGAQDFGDVPVDTSSAPPAAKPESAKHKKKAASHTRKAA